MECDLLAWLRLSAWRMPVFRPYGLEHLLLLFGLTPLVVVLAWRLRSVKERTIDRILFWLGLALILAEVYKELFLSYVIEGAYCYADFPFQLCSMPMYLCPLMLFLAKEKKRVCYLFIGTYNFLGGIAAILEPSSSFYPYITLTLHSVLWHQALIFIGCLLWFSGLCRIDRSSFQRATLLYLMLCGIAYGLNALLMEPSGGVMNLFFLGPGVAPVIVMDWVSIHWGAMAETILMMGVTVFGSGGLGIGFQCLIDFLNCRRYNQ
ncbi:MAG: YwaF family protein [Clostridiales bacterium]|nr:YwaF family protein [Clostridiales bacterium]